MAAAWPRRVAGVDVRCRRYVGHHHRRRDARLDTYPGNPDPLTFGEAGELGAVVATLAPGGEL